MLKYIVLIVSISSNSAYGRHYKMLFKTVIDIGAILIDVKFGTGYGASRAVLSSRFPHKHAQHKHVPAALRTEEASRRGQ